MAKTIDMLIVLATYFIFQAILPQLAWMLAVAMVVSFDGWGTGQSPGKRIMGLRVIEDYEGDPAGFKESLIRNLPLLLPFLFLGTFLFWMVVLLVSLPWIFLEVYLVFNLASGVRLGDVLANTLVVESMDESTLNFQSPKTF